MWVSMYMHLCVWIFISLLTNIYGVQFWKTDWIPFWHTHYWQNCQLFPAWSLNCQYVSWKGPRFISSFQVQFAYNLLAKKVHHCGSDCHSESSIVFSSGLIYISCADHHAEQFWIPQLQSLPCQTMRRLLTPLCWKHIK